MSKLSLIQDQIRALGHPETAKLSQRFFKTGVGEYGAGDVFLGIKVPVLRKQVLHYRGTPAETSAALLQSQFHEERLFALLLLIDFFQQGGAADQALAYQTYLSNTHRINNWDLVDVSAPHIVGHYLSDKSRAVLYQLASSSSLWERRIAIIATLHFIRQNDFADTLHLAEQLLQDKQDLMHKAVGWMLREVGKRDQETEEKFLRQHYRAMPRTLLRYAIERFPEPLRQQYLQGNV